MFEDSLLEYGGRLKTKKPLTVFISFVIQTVVIGILILIPLIYTEALPKHELMTFLMAPPPPPPPPPPPAPAPKIVIRPKIVPQQPQQMVQPKFIPKQIAQIKDEALPSASIASGVVGGVEGGIPGGSSGGLLGAVTAAAPPPPPPPPPPQRVRVGGQVQTSMLINQVRPVYPALARQARIQGTVHLEAVISKDGTIQDLKLISGHPLLVKAAMDAVRQWRYRPTMLNGVPVEVITTIDVTFTLGG